jgi:hypothetical protein
MKMYLSLKNMKNVFYLHFLWGDKLMYSEYSDEMV